MTGPEHYLKAEQLLATAVKIHNAAEKVSNENGGLLPEVHQGSQYAADAASGLEIAVRALAAVYAAHPDFLDEWKPLEPF